MDHYTWDIGANRGSPNELLKFQKFSFKETFKYFSKIPIKTVMRMMMRVLIDINENNKPFISIGKGKYHMNWNSFAVFGLLLSRFIKDDCMGEFGRQIIREVIDLLSGNSRKEPLESDDGSWRAHIKYNRAGKFQLTFYPMFLGRNGRVTGFPSIRSVKNLKDIVENFLVPLVLARESLYIKYTLSRMVLEIFRLCSENREFVDDEIWKELESTMEDIAEEYSRYVAILIGEVPEAKELLVPEAIGLIESLPIDPFWRNFMKEELEEYLE